MLDDVLVKHDLKSKAEVTETLSAADSDAADAKEEKRSDEPLDSHDDDDYNDNDNDNDDGQDELAVNPNRRRYGDDDMSDEEEDDDEDQADPSSDRNSQEEEPDIPVNDLSAGRGSNRSSSKQG